MIFYILIALILWPIISYLLVIEGGEEDKSVAVAVGGFLSITWPVTLVGFAIFRLLHKLDPEEEDD